MDLVKSVAEKLSSTIYRGIPNKVAEGKAKLNQIVSEVAHTKLSTPPTTPRALRTAATADTDKDGFVVFPSLIEPPSQERVCDSDEEREEELDELVKEHKALFSLEIDAEIEESDSDNEKLDKPIKEKEQEKEREFLIFLNEGNEEVHV